jgi:hypothetical protein
MESKRISLPSNEFIKELNQLYSQITPEDKDSYWWSTFSGNRDRYNSDLIKLLENLYLNLSIEEITAKYSGPKFYLKTFSKFLKSIAYIGRFFLNTIAIKNLFKKKKGILLESTKDSNFIRSFAYKNSFTNGIYADPFFKQLNKEINPITIYFPLCSINDLKRNSLAEDKALPLQCFVPLHSYFFAFFNFFKAIKYRCPRVKFKDREISGLIQRMYYSEVFNPLSIQGIENYYAIKSISKTIKIKKWIQTYENIIWERYSTHAVQKFASAEVIGYQHSAIPQSAINYYLTGKEFNHSYLPNRILTTGELTKDILSTYGEYSSNNLESACALRYDYIDKLTLKNSRIDKNVLIALDGHHSSREVVAYLISQLPVLNDFNIKIREHPLLPIKSFLTKEQNSILDSNNVKVSDSTIQEDINWSSFLIYRGTTVSLEALSIGTPIIHYNVDKILSYDPAYLFDYLHETVRSDSNLLNILNKYLDYDLEELNKERALSRDLVLNYFKTPTSDTLKSFI